MRELRRLRKQKGWNQNKLAFHADLAPSVISLVETGRREPNATTLRKLATALGVEIPDLFPRVSTSPSPESQPEKEEELRRSVKDWEDVLKSVAALYEQAEKELRGAPPGVFPNKVIDVAVLASYELQSLSRESDDVREATDVVAAAERIRSANVHVERMIDQYLNPMDEAHAEQTARFKGACRRAVASLTSMEERDEHRAVS